MSTRGRIGRGWIAAAGAWAALGLAGAVLLPAAPLASEGEVVDGLAPGPNQEAVVNNCTACHSGRTIAQARLTRSQWDDVIDWMHEAHGMWQLQPEVREQILDYLETVYGYRRES
jgi:mono/diheme cytochrome c family protein